MFLADSATKMTTKNILQPLDVNSSKMEKSPARKRARYESPVKDRWSLTHNNVKLDEVFDYGLGVLDSDSDTQTDDEDCTAILSYESSSSCKRPREELDDEKQSPHQPNQNISLEEWDNFLIKKTEITNDTNIEYFSMLSDEVILHIFHFLPKRQLIHVACVSSRFHQLTRDESLWTRMDVSNRVLNQGALGQILSRQVVILRLSQSEIAHPAIRPHCRAANDEFQSRLLYLDLSMVHIPIPSLVQVFSKCRRLKKLSLEHVTLNNEVLQALSNNRELEVLNLAMAEGIQLDGLKALLSRCLRIRELNFAWTFLSSAAVKYICGHLPKTLDRLNISGCRKLMTDTNVSELVKHCPGLRELDMSDCTGLTGNSIQHMLSLEELNFLALSRCYLIPYRSFLSLKSIQSLVYLDIHGGYIDLSELKIIQETLGSQVHINKFKFSSVARPTVGPKRSSIWNLRVRD